MSRLIDADELIKDWGFGTNCDKCNRDAYQCQYHQTFTAMDVCGMIEFATTVDAVEVIRCKDCKHCITDKGDLISVNVCELNHNKVQPDDWFCADGEREKDG